MLKKLKPAVSFLKGMVIGVSNLVPGVSGGTMALVMGIYERLVEAIGEFLTNKKRRKEFFLFLLPIVLGAAAGILLFARIFSFLLSSPIYSQPTYFFFIGLILGSVPFLIAVHHDMKIRPARAVFFLIGLGLVVSLAFLMGRDNTVGAFSVHYSILDMINITGIGWKYALWLFFCGIITSSAMVIPGVSGSALLLGLGEYRNILYFVSELMAVQLVIFGIGVIVGIVACARLIDFCLKRFPANTYYFIMGLVIASVFQIVMQSLEGLSLSPLPVILSISAIVAGFALTYALSRIKKKDKPFN